MWTVPNETIKLVVSQSSLYNADEIKALDSLVVAIVSDFSNHLCWLPFSVPFQFYKRLGVSAGTRITLHIRYVDKWEYQYLVSGHKIAGNEFQYSVGWIAAFICLFLTLNFFGDDDSQIPLLIIITIIIIIIMIFIETRFQGTIGKIIKYRCNVSRLDSSLVTTVDWTYYSCHAWCSVRCASQNIYQHWNSFATCLPIQQVFFIVSFRSSVMSSGFLALWQSLVSSANLDILLTILVSISLIYMYKKQ